MATQPDNQRNSKVGKGALSICFVLFGIYFINVLVGKINISFSLRLPHFGNVAEFLLLFGACLLMIIAALKRETAAKMTLTQTNQTKKG